MKSFFSKLEENKQQQQSRQDQNQIKSNKPKSDKMATVQTIPFNNTLSSTFRSPDFMHEDKERMNSSPYSIGGPSTMKNKNDFEMSIDRSERLNENEFSSVIQTSSNSLLPPPNDQQPTKKRTQSCDICRIRKVKCIRITEEKGSKCKQCESNDANCTYTYIPKKPGPQTSSAKAIARKEEKDRQIRAAAAAAMLAKGMTTKSTSLTTNKIGNSGKSGLYSSSGAGSGIESGGERSSGSSRRSSIPGQPSPSLFQPGHLDITMNDFHHQRPNVFSSLQSSSNTIPPSTLASSQPTFGNFYSNGPNLPSNTVASGSHSTPSSYGCIAGMHFDGNPLMGQKSRPGSPSLSNSMPFGISPASSGGLNRAACLHSNHSSISGMPTTILPSHPQSRSASSSRSSSPRLHRINNTLEGSNPFVHAFTPIHPNLPSTSTSSSNSHPIPGMNAAIHHNNVNDNIDSTTSANASEPTYSFPWLMPFQSAESSTSNKSSPMNSVPHHHNHQQQQQYETETDLGTSSLHRDQQSLPISADPMPFLSSSSYNYDPVAMSHQLYEHALQWQQQHQQQHQQQQYRYHQQNQQGGIDIEDLQNLIPVQNPSNDSDQNTHQNQQQQRSEQWSEFWNFPSQNSN